MVDGSPNRPSPGGAEATGETDVVPVAREELRTTFEYQVQRLREIDGKAIELLKANLLLIGLVVTAGSILVQTEIDVAAFVNAFTVAGGLLLLVSTGLAGVTYTSSNLRGGLDADAVETAIADEGDGEFQERLLRSYARWIDYNARMTAVNDILVTVTVLLVVVAFVYVLVGVIVGFAPVSTATAIGLFVVLTLLLGWVTRRVYHMDHLGPRDARRHVTFDGVRLSKGTTRSEGLDTLKVMFARKPDDEE